MIDALHLQGFKAIADVSVRLGQVNVFIGANGSGKSSLLEAIGVLGAAVDGVVDDAALTRRGVRLGVPALYKTSLKEQRHPRLISLGARSGEPEAEYRVGLDNPIEEPLPAWRYHSERLEVAGELWLGRSRRGMRTRAGENGTAIQPTHGYAQQLLGVQDLPASARAMLEALRGYRIYTPLTPILQGVSPDPMPLRPLGLSGGGLAELLEDLLQQRNGEQQIRSVLSDMVDWVETVKILPPSKSRIPSALPTTRRILVFTDRWMREKRNQISAYDASEGVLYVLFILVLALAPELPAFLAVDNVGYGLHPRLVRRLMRHFCDLLLQREMPRQVLLTTHDPLLLDGLPLMDERVRLFVVERDGQGAVDVRRVEVTPALWEQKEQAGMTLSDLWVEGWLGGVPDLW